MVQLRCREGVVVLPRRGPLCCLCPGRLGVVRSLWQRIISRTLKPLSGIPPRPWAPRGSLKERSLSRRRRPSLRWTLVKPPSDADWAHAYAESACWGADWELVNSPGPDWPKGIKVFGEKMYQAEKLCVPEKFVARVVREHHVAAAHVVGKRFLAELARRYIFPPATDFRTEADRVRRECPVCQACEPPTYSVREEVHMTPVPDRFMASVCLDIFSMPATEWLGQPFDSYLLCVDRLTGWMVARPTTKQGMTGERAAHLLLDSSWGEVGIPSIVTCDQGTQFTSQWFATMCQRLGVRMGFSQAYRPQANGRAEICGHIL